MEKTRLPVRTWYLSLIFISISKEGVFVTELQNLIGNNMHESARTVINRVRQAMQRRDCLNILTKMIEFGKNNINSDMIKIENPTIRKGIMTQYLPKIALAK
ncbi:MAG: hypothetical protein AB7S72_15435 [Draconibacterium sp.]